MLVSEKRIALFCAVALIILRSSGIQGQEKCDVDVAKGFDGVKTYRSGLERFLQDLGGAVKTVAGSGGGAGSAVFGIITGPFSFVLDQFAGQVHAIFPGTLWCGAGNVAKNASYLGPFDRTDACCRSHDECATNINASSSYGNLVNNGIFTRSACGCDHAFYQCLKRANSLLSAGIGNTYFNILRPQCFTCDHPIVGCAKKDNKRFVDKKCATYELAANKSMILQWFDNPDF